MSRRSLDKKRRQQQQQQQAVSRHSAAYEPGTRLAADNNFIEPRAARRATSIMKHAVGLSAFLALLLYLNTLPADFAYDDSRAILKNPDVLGETQLQDLFHNDFWGTPLTHSGSHKSYRPLCVLTFRLNHQFGGLDPTGYHLVNVVLHAVVTALFTYTAQSLLGRGFVTFTAGLMFAAHPIHTEAVAGIVGRADILACLFFLLSFQCYMKYCKYRDKGGTPRWAWLGGVLACTTAGMLSKEQAVTVLGVCAIYDVFLHSKLTVKQALDLLKIWKKEHRNVIEGIFGLGIIGTLLISGRVYFMGNKPPEFAPADNPASDSNSLLTRTLTYNYLPVLNFWLLLYPSILSFDWSMDAVPLVESVFDYRNLFTLFFYGTLFYVVCYIVKSLETDKTSTKDTKTAYTNGFKHPHKLTNGISNGHVANGFARNGHARHRHTTNNSRRSSSSSSSDSGGDSPAPASSSVLERSAHIIIISLAILILPFIPATNLFFYVGFVIAERILYIPSMGFCILVAYSVNTVHQKVGATGGGSALSESGGFKKHLMHILVGCLLLAYSVRTVQRNEDWSNEESLYKAGISVNPAKAWGNLANILNSQGRSAEAEQAYRAALTHRANMADVHYNLGILLQEQERYTEAIESYKLAIQCRPRLTMAHLNLAIVYAAVGRKAEAEQIFRHCAEIDTEGLKDPRLHEQTKISALYNLARQLADEDRHQEAINIYKEAIERRPSHYTPQSLYNMLGESYSKLDDLTSAEHWYQQALTAKPDHVPAHLTMGKLFKRKGDIAEAESWFLKALILDPKDSSAYQHFGQFLGEVGRHAEAADNYWKAAALTPGDFELIFNTANALRQAGKNSEAEDYYRRAAQLKPNEATAHMNLGAMLHFNNKLMEAEQSYLSALRLRPEDSTTQMNLQRLRNLIKSKATAAGG